MKVTRPSKGVIVSTMKKKPGDLDILGGDHSLLSVGVSIWSLACMWSNTTSLNAKKKQVTHQKDIFDALLNRFYLLR